MKKIKFVGLPILALTAIAGLASCAGESAPKQKPGVIFHASAAILEKDDEGVIVEKAIDFKDKECAMVTINNEEGLQYGKQDVEIFVEPNGFFTFRKYDTDSWAALTESMPAHPYVGLGSPVSLYSYPLQENVAWTFTDLSEQIKDESGQFTGFYKEKYKITVKKEYFQKNIVVDYGNVASLNNRVYVYNSARYSEMFSSKPASGDFGKYYVNNTQTSSYAAASLGATVTYNFSNSTLDNIYTFYGWDAAPTQSANSNADKLPYEHFAIYGTYHDKEGKEIKENIAMYEPGVAPADQAFIPTVIEKEKKESLSFFIRWDLLAYGKEQGYENKYESIEVEIKEPTPNYIPGDVKADEGITVYPAGLFQHKNSIKTLPYDTTGTFNTYTKDSSGKEKTLTFENVYESSERTIYYSTLFELPNDKSKNSFAVSIDEDITFEVDLVYGKPLITNGHTQDEDGQTIEGETELYYWQNNEWYLVQLNPSSNSKLGERTYGLPPEGFVGKDNLYYLYTTGVSTLSKGELDINIELVETKVVTFELTNTTYGKFFGGEEEGKKITLPCGNKSTVAIPFIATAGYQPSNFIFTVTSGDRTDLTAKYLGKDEQSIEIYSTSAIAFGDGVTCTIDITLPETKVKLLDSSTKELGSLYVNEQEVEEFKPTITVGEPITIPFKFKSAKAQDVSNMASIRVLYNGSDVTFTPEPSKSDDTLLNIKVNYDSQFKTMGDLFEVSIKYVIYTYEDNLKEVGSTEAGLIDKNTLCEIVSKDFSKEIPMLHLRITAYSETSLANYTLVTGSVTTSKYAESFKFGNLQAKGGFQQFSTNLFEIHIHATVTQMGALTKIPNGLDLAINLTFAAPATK